MGFFAHLLTACVALACAVLPARAADALSPFPKPEAGMQRLVIELPSKGEHEGRLFKVELSPGRVMPTDGVNAVAMDVHLERHHLQGWGYTWYKLVGSGRVASTLMAAPSDARVPAFVAGKPLMIRYNHRLPIVIYVPNGYSVRYRIWQAGERWHGADPR